MASAMGIITKSAMVVALATVDDAGTIHSSNSAVPSASGGDPVHSSSANYFFCSLLVQRVHVPLFNVCSVVHRFGKPQTCKHVIKSCHMEGGFEMRMGCLRDVNVISGLPAAISAGRLDIQDDERHVTRYAFPTWQDVVAADSKSIENAIRRGSLAVTEVSCIKKMLNCLLGRKCKLCLGYLCDLTVDEIKTELSHFKGIGLKTVTCVLMFHIQRDDFFFSCGHTCNSDWEGLWLGTRRRRASLHWPLLCSALYPSCLVLSLQSYLVSLG